MNGGDSELRSKVRRIGMIVKKGRKKEEEEEKEEKEDL